MIPGRASAPRPKRDGHRDVISGFAAQTYGSLVAPTFLRNKDAPEDSSQNRAQALITETEEYGVVSMIPLSDASRRLKRFPTATVVIIVLNALVFVLELSGGDAFVKQWSVIPADIVARKNWVTILTAMFMHGGWMHIIGNMVFLKAFGPEIEDAMGRIGYSTFYILSGIAASLAQIVAMPESNVPNLGASGAIAGVMGAFLITYPHDRIRTLFFFGIFTRIALIPAALLIGIWFLIQLFSEIGAVANVQSGGVAYMAHLGGFIFGAVSARLFESSPRTPELET